jgi:hypothetical protein
MPVVCAKPGRAACRLRLAARARRNRNADLDEQPLLQLPDTRTRATAPTTFIVTATTLIQVAGFAILTDPDFLHRGDRALARCQMASPAWTTSACGGATASEA